MGNNQTSGIHKRERTGDGRNRLVSGGFPPVSGGPNLGVSPNTMTHNHNRTTTDDGCPVQVCVFELKAKTILLWIICR